MVCASAKCLYVLKNAPKPSIRFTLERKDYNHGRKGPMTGFGANSNQGQIVTNIGYYLGLLVSILNDSLMILPIPY